MLSILLTLAQVAAAVVVVVPPDLLGDAQQLEANDVGISASIEWIPNSMVVDCTDPDTVPGGFAAGSCQAGADDSRWCVSPDGKRRKCAEDFCTANWFPSCNLTQYIAWMPNGASSHGYVKPEGTPSGSLVVFLPGTGGTWDGYSRLLLAAAKAGHHVLGLNYMSQPVSSAMANRWCDPNPPGYVSTASECNNEFHQQMLFGDENVESRFKGKSGRLWAVTRKNSVEGLVLAALVQKKDTWGGGFLDNAGNVDWKKIIISGHSQGASHGAYLSQVRGVRAVLFSGPQDSGASTLKWAVVPVPNGLKRRSLYHGHEECADEPKGVGSYCQEHILPEVLKLMGFGPASTWNGEADKLPDSLENVVSYAPVKPTCVSGRTWHGSTAGNGCAPDSMEAIWLAMFQNMENAPTTLPPTLRGARRHGSE